MIFEDHVNKLQKMISILELNTDYLCQYIQTLVTRIRMLEQECTHDFHQQSEEVVIDTQSKVASGEESEQTTKFLDECLGDVQDFTSVPESISIADELDVANLRDFLSRPVRLDSFTWSETDSAATLLRTINPWSVFFNDSRIRNKLHNFAFLRCNLHIKVVVNASPFYYGIMGMPYQPLHVLTPSTIITSTSNVLMPLSQRPIMWIHPQDSEAGEMVLPFFYHKNWLEVNSNQDFADMGKLDFWTFTTLQSANGVTGTGVTVQVYGWAEDVHLSGSTLSLAVQSKEESYGIGPISAPASTVARLAGGLRNAPIIGKFATATEIGANAVAGIAKIFGYSNTPVISDIQPYRPSAFQHLASSEISFPNEKLTLDPKNELTVDPSVVGAPSGDPLSIPNFVTRESYLATFNWATSNNVDDILFCSRVNPWMYRMTSDAINGIIDNTPLAIVSQLFDGWKGDIVFRFNIVCSPYHKGRLVIAFDPYGDATNNLVNTANTTSAVYTTIVDIGTTNNVEIRVPYVQALPFLKSSSGVYSVANVPIQTSGPFTFNKQAGIDNGFLSVRVLTTLTAPVLVAPVSILVFVKGTPEMKFGNPRRPPNGVSRFIAQSVETTVVELGKSSGETPIEQFRVNYGEVISSLRTLLHRGNFIYTQGDPNATALGPQYMLSTFGKIPPYRGFDPNGIHTAVKQIGIGNAPYNFTRNTPVTWILPCFVGYRGSTVWTFNTNSSGAIGSINVVRQPLDVMQWIDTTTGGLIVSTKSGIAANYEANKQATSGGCALTNQFTQAGLSVVCPNYNQYRFCSTSPVNSTLPPTSGRAYEGTAYDTFKLEVISSPVSPLSRANGYYVEKYWHAGSDFQPLFFLNCPSLYNTPNNPTPV